MTERNGGTEMPTSGNSRSDLEEQAFLEAVKAGIPKTVSTIEGDELEIKKLSWRKRIAGMEIVSKVYEQIWGQEGRDEGGRFTFVDAYRAILLNCPGYLTELASIATGKEAAWIEEHLDDETVLRIACPFFATSISIRDRMMQIMIPEMAAVAKAVQMKTAESGSTG